MNIVFRKFFYGDIPEDTTGGSELKDSSKIPPSGDGGATGLFGRYLSVVSRAWTINMLAVCMPPTHKWPSKMQEMYIQEDKKA